MEKQKFMKVLNFKIVMATTVVFGVIILAEVIQGNRVYDEYMVKKEQYEKRVVEVRTNFLALPNEKEWRRKIIRLPSFERIGGAGEGYIYLSGKLAEFAEKYTQEEIIAGIWDILDNLTPDRMDSLVALFYATQNWNAYALQFPNEDARNRIKNTFKHPYFSGFDFELVRMECVDELYPQRTDMIVRLAKAKGDEAYAERILKAAQNRKNPAARRLEYIDAIVKILADQDIRKENPLEFENLFLILFEVMRIHNEFHAGAIQTFVDYMFYDKTTGADYRLQEGDLEIVGPEISKPHNIDQVAIKLFLLTMLGKKYIPATLARFADASAEERSVETGGGGTPIHAIIYFRRLGVSVDEAIQHVENYKEEHKNLTDGQKEALDEIILFIKEKRFCSDALLEDTNEAVRTWAPSYGKDAAIHE